MSVACQSYCQLPVTGYWQKDWHTTDIIIKQLMPYTAIHLYRTSPIVTAETISL